MSWEEKVVVEGMGREDPEPEEPLWRNHFSSPAAAGWSGGVSAETGESWVPSVSPPPCPFPSLLPVFPLPLWYISNPTSPVSSKWYVPLVTFQDFSEVKYAPGSQIRQSPQAVLPFSTLPHASAQSCAVDWGGVGGRRRNCFAALVMPWWCKGLHRNVILGVEPLSLLQSGPNSSHFVGLG